MQLVHGSNRRLSSCAYSPAVIDRFYTIIDSRFYKTGGGNAGRQACQMAIMALMCNGTTKAKQKRSTKNAEPHVGCTNKPGR